MWIICTEWVFVFLYVVKWSRKPRSRVKHYILRLAEDTGQEFGSRIHYFIETTLMRISEPHQKLLSDVSTCTQ